MIQFDVHTGRLRPINKLRELKQYITLPKQIVMIKKSYILGTSWLNQKNTKLSQNIYTHPRLQLRSKMELSKGMAV